jgi:hypothetical protein
VFNVFKFVVCQAAISLRVTYSLNHDLQAGIFVILYLVYGVGM